MYNQISQIKLLQEVVQLEINDIKMRCDEFNNSRSLAIDEGKVFAIQIEDNLQTKSKLYRVFVIGIDFPNYLTVGWIIHKGIQNCLNCRRSFGIFFYKYNCWACGNLLCSSCLPHRIIISELKSLGPVPVCEQCYWGQDDCNAIHTFIDIAMPNKNHIPSEKIKESSEFHYQTQTQIQMHSRPTSYLTNYSSNTKQKTSTVLSTQLHTSSQSHKDQEISEDKNLYPNVFYEEILLQACQAGDLVGAVNILPHCPTVNFCDKNDMTPLHLACLGDHGKIASMLLKSLHCDVNLLTKKSWTALHIACYNGNTELVRLLLQCGARVNQTSQSGCSALHCACESGEEAVVALLLEHGADPHARSARNMTPLHWASEFDRTAAATLLLRTGASVNARDTKQLTPLHYACENGFTKLAELLLANGADVGVTSSYGWTPLHFACSLARLSAVELLLHHGANVLAQDAYCWTPLHCACENAHISVVLKLLECGAHINGKGAWNKSPLHLAYDNKHLHLADELLKRGADANALNRLDGATSLLHKAAIFDNDVLLLLLLDHGAAVNALDQLGRTPLHWACIKRNGPAALMLLEHSADPSIDDKYRRTPLQYAALAQDPALANMLQEYQRMLRTRNELADRHFVVQLLHRRHSL